jgi:eukaryotic-like serine/threonine-protein kinase
MNKERSQQVYELFLEAIPLAQAERERLLEERCSGDPDLRAAVEKLLASDAQAERDEFLPLQNSVDVKRPALPLRIENAHIRCPNCDNPIEVVCMSETTEVYCPSCHSSFRLERHASLPWSPWIGEKKVEQFELIDVLGYGACGTVYKAHDTKLDRMVAIKVLRAGNLARAEEKARFLRESRITAQLCHRAIVPVYDVGEYDGSPFIISEFIQGTTLTQWLVTHKPTFEESAALVSELADALQYTHDNGVIHRDVKSSNVIVDDNGQPHLTDFGLAKREANEIAITIDNQVIGTPAYMSPEQARGEGSKVDGRTDVYSLGVLLYEMLTGELPFRGSTRMLLHQVLWDEPKSPRSLNDRIPPDLETICLQSMAKEPSRRYATAGKLAEDLERFKRHEEIEGRPADSLERTWRWCRRNPKLASLVGVTAASLVAVALLSVLFAANAHRWLVESYRHLAVVDFNVARSACEQNELEVGVLWIERCLADSEKGSVPDWARFARASLAAWSQELPRLKGVFSNNGEVPLAVFSPDGQTILTVSADRSARLWYAATGRPRSKPLVHEGRVRFGAFSPNGQTVVTASFDRKAQLWDVATGQPLHAPLSHDRPVSLATFSADGSTILTLDELALRLWDVGTGQPRVGPVEHGLKLNTMCVSPDARTLLLSGHDKTVQLWDALALRRRGAPLPHPEVLWGRQGAAFSNDGKTLATASVDGKVRLWDVATGRSLGRPLEQKGAVLSVAFSPDGNALVAGTEGKLARLWDVKTGVSRGEPLRHDGAVCSAEFSPDGKTVLTAGWDHSARLWDAATGLSIGRPLRHQGVVNSATFSPNGQTVLTASSDRTARLWNIASPASAVRPIQVNGAVVAAAMGARGQNVLVGTDRGEAILCDATSGQAVQGPWLHGNSVCAVAIGNDGAIALTGGLDGRVRFWNAKTGIAVGQPLELGKQIVAHAFSPDNLSAVVTSFDKAWICDLKTGQVRGKPLQHGDTINSVAFGPGGKTIATGSDDNTARIWDGGTGEPLGQPLTHSNRVYAVALSPNGRTLLTGCVDGSAQLWDVRNGQNRVRRLPHNGAVLAVAFGPDGSTAFTASFDKTAWIWDLAAGKPRGPMLAGHEGPVHTLVVSRDGQLVATASFDGSARLWDATLGLPVGPPLIHPQRVLNVEFSQDGGTVLTVCADGIARLWKLTRPSEKSEQDARRIGALTGLTLTDQGEIQLLDTEAWLAHRATSIDSESP